LAGRDYFVAFALLIAASTFHDSHLLILFALLVMAAAYNILIRSWTNWIGLTVVALCIVMGLLAQSIFSVAVRRIVGAPPLRPPFLMARTIEDGPGYRYIRATCPANGFRICEFSDRLPLPADDFLWKSGPAGVFASASPEKRRELSNEQMRFMLAVIAHDPWGQLSASLNDAAAQLIEIGLSEFQYDASEKQGFAAKIPSEHLEKLRASAAFRGTMPIRFFSAVIQITVLIAGIVVVWAFLRRSHRPTVATAALPITVWILIGILVNAAVCGILSGPHDRYSARVAWLLPFAAILIAEGRR
jgi:hypothetical protein